MVAPMLEVPWISTIYFMFNSPALIMGGLFDLLCNT